MGRPGGVVGRLGPRPTARHRAVARRSHTIVPTGRETGVYTDAGSAAGIGGYGTFPSSLPGELGAAIDHVLVDLTRFSVRAGAVVDVPGTDHRAVVVRIALVDELAADAYLFATPPCVSKAIRSDRDSRVPVETVREGGYRRGSRDR